MNQTVLIDLSHNKQRLDYYTRLRAKTSILGKSPKAPKSVEKWIEIYAERVKTLEKQATKLGAKIS